MIDHAVDGGVATVTIDRPERHNALTWDGVEELLHALRTCRADPATRVVVLQGAGGRAFCSGADLGGMTGGTEHVALHHARGGFARAFEELWGLGKPTIAKVRGYALAGGLGLALACDVVVASDDATFGTPEIDVGLWPFMITVPMLRSMPPKVALELMMSGRRVPADEALRLGFVSRVVAAADLDAEVESMAASLATKSPTAMRLGRDAFYAAMDLGAADALRLLHPMLTVAAASADAAEGAAAFAERRPPSWSAT